ncbi:MAG TPA: rhamnulokinase [Planctomycetaceae bacterium]|nr:rhamnulokinase [Planctomycetaceae bacterium]HRF00237.1 rhamnulokinase family protein [Pirellulaceae bacterium]
MSAGSVSHRIGMAVDLGASGGRLLAGPLDAERFSLEELHRFPNGGIAVGRHLHWDVLRLWSEIKEGLAEGGRRFGSALASVGVDTWGVDFGLLDESGELLGNPHHYRDSQNLGMLEAAFDQVPRDDIFAATGLQFMEFNSLYQLLAMRQRRAGALDAATSLLMMPDLFHYFLTGIRSNEATNASTSQCFDPTRGDWARPLLERFGLPTEIFGPLSLPGTRLGPVTDEVRRETGLGAIDVVLPGTHDTASAVMAVPAESRPGEMPDWCYISSGTWSLMGVELPRPMVTADVFAENFTNEGGVGGTTRLLKNIAGLWLVQECRRIWQRSGHEFGWSDLVARAEKSPPLGSFIFPDHADFLAPADMPTAIRDYCQATGQTVPDSEGAVIRCALESLALRYREVLETLERFVGRRIERIHIVGGGTQNRLLNQMAADACRREVIAGPVEATAIGNLAMQSIALGSCDSIAEARRRVRSSFEMQVVEPRNSAAWDDAYGRFLKLPR